MAALDENVTCSMYYYFFIYLLCNYKILFACG